MAATRAGLKGASSAMIPNGASIAEAWEIGARVLGTTPSALAAQVATAVRLPPANMDSADLKSARLVPERLAGSA